MSRVISTFSIAAYDPNTKELGVAVQSKTLACASVVPWCEAGAGAIATQALANTSYGPRGLALLKEGKTPKEVIEIVTSEDPMKENRQLGIVDSRGDAAIFTGQGCLPWAGGITGKNFAIQGNLLTREETVKAMALAFQETKSPLARRLMESLAAGQREGGDRRGRQSAGLLVVKEKEGYGRFNDRYIDLRVDDHPAPIRELKRLLEMFFLYHSDEEGEHIAIEGSLIEEIKEKLNVLGYYHGSINRVFDEGLEEALGDFYFNENFAEKRKKRGSIDERILEYMRYRAKRKERVAMEE